MAADLHTLLKTAQECGLVMVIGRDADDKATSLVAAYVGDNTQSLVDALNAVADTWQEDSPSSEETSQDA